MTRTFGTEDEVLQDRFLYQAIMAVGDFVGHKMESFDHVVAALKGIGPKDTLEGMLAVQMVAVHTLAMECMGRAAVKEQPDLGVEVNLSRATKLHGARRSPALLVPPVEDRSSQWNSFP
jgi:hypothetical protein